MISKILPVQAEKFSLDRRWALQGCNPRMLTMHYNLLRDCLFICFSVAIICCFSWGWISVMLGGWEGFDNGRPVAFSTRSADDSTRISYLFEKRCYCGLIFLVGRNHTTAQIKSFHASFTGFIISLQGGFRPVRINGPTRTLKRDVSRDSKLSQSGADMTLS